MEVDKDISKDKKKGMIAKMGDSISIKTLKRGSWGSVNKGEGSNWICLHISVIANIYFHYFKLEYQFQFSKIIWFLMISHAYLDVRMNTLPIKTYYISTSHGRNFC